MQKWIVTIALTFPCCAFGQDVYHKNESAPPPGLLAKASIGDPMFEKNNYYYSKIVFADGSVRASKLGQRFVLNVGEPLDVIRGFKDKLKACTQAQFGGSFMSAGPSCFIDDDMDGTFDRTDSIGLVSKGKRLEPPIPYHIGELITATPGAYKAVISYLGIDGKTLRLSFREYNNTLTQASFSEELSVPITEHYPQRIVVKGATIELISADGVGLTYRIEKYR